MLGLVALKTEWYLLLLALVVVRRMGNLTFPRYWRLLGLLISFLLLRMAVLIIEMVSGEALWLPAISAWSWLTAPLSETSLYSLYMLWFPVLDWYLKTMPKVLTWLGLLSKISLTDKICPWADLVLSWLRKWYQNLDLAMTLFLAKRLMAKTFGLGSCSVASLRPRTRYCLIYELFDRYLHLKRGVSWILSTLEA